jgi:hypothetical protein
MENPRAQSFKQLTISVEKLPASMGRQETLTNYAAQRAKLLLGCYRTGEANDPETYVTAITAILAHYPEEIITAVTHPVSGLPSKKSWLPTVKEVVDACDESFEPIRQNELRMRRIKEQMAARAEQDRLAERKPTFEEMKAKYGDNWGLTPARPKAKPIPAPSWDEIASAYSADPELISRLLGNSEVDE